VALLAGAAGPASALYIPRAARPAEGRVLVLDDCDPEFKGKDSYADNLSCISTAGGLVFRVSGFNNCECIGSSHMVAGDPARGCVWALENVAHRIRKFDRAGKELLSLPAVQANALAVDPATGNLWVLTSKGTIDGDKTEVFRADGKHLATHDVSGWDITYDRKGKAFWVAGSRLAKLDARSGAVAFVKPITAWCSSSVAADPRTGMVWVTVRRHPHVVNSRNVLLRFDGDGTLRQSVPLGDSMPFRVSVDPRRGTAWVTLFRKSLQRYAADGRREAEFPVPALTAVADPTGGGAWVVTREETLRLGPRGNVLRRVKHKGPTSQAWVTGF
jgi:DNA-binding beta-propeller fold protein YncE